MKITVKDFIDDLKNYDPDLEMNFGGLDFYRLKEVGNSCFIEFNQSVYKDDNGDVIVINHKVED